MSTRCQVLTIISKKGHDATGVCKNYGKKFFRVKTNGRYNQDRVIGICAFHLPTYGDPNKWVSSRYGWEVGKIRWFSGSILEWSEVDVSSLKSIQRSQKYEAMKERLKTLMSYKASSNLSREEWQDLFQEALDEFCVESVMGA